MSIVNPNMVQLQNFLKKMSPQEWSQFVQNPSTQVPGLLISMESERRIKENNETKNAQAQVPTGTVAQKVNAEAASLGTPPMGLGSLPPTMMAQAPNPQMNQAPVQMAEGGLTELDTGNMFNEANFATGGIVAFDDGGYVLPEDYDPEEYQRLMAEKLVAEDERYAGLPGIAGESALSRGLKKIPRGMEHQKNIQNITQQSPSPYGPALNYYQGLLKQPGTDKRSLLGAIEELQGQQTQYRKGIPFGDLYGSKDIIPTKDNTPPPPPADIKDKGKVGADMSPQDKLRAANSKYSSERNKVSEDQGSAYDKSIERLMSIYKEEDPARAEMKAEYAKRKSNALYDFAGDLGYGLSQAKKGREFEAAGAGLSRAQTRADALTKEGKDLKLEDMKAQRELKLIGAKYGFESEQFKDKLKFTEKLEDKKMANDLEKANIIYGYKAKGLDSAQLVKQDKYVKDWLAGEGKAYAPYLAADENAKGISDKMKTTIIAAKKALNAKKAEATTRFNTMDNYGPNGFAASDPLGLLQ
jgi:hypothetical protein